MGYVAIAWLGMRGFTVFLQPAVGLLGDSAFDEAGIEGWFQVVLSEGAAFREPH